MLDARQALRRLCEGNRRFLTDTSDREILRGASQLSRHTGGQAPIAVILGCSDSRVPAEIIFDQGMGSLFVIRVAGNIVAPSQIGSIEYAAQYLGTRLVVVLGHSNCGAVKAALEDLEGGASPGSRNLGSILGRIRPVVEELRAREGVGDPETLLARAVRANVRASVEQLHRGSEIVTRLIEQQGLLVVGADYSLETGVVEFFDVTGYASTG